MRNYNGKADFELVDGTAVVIAESSYKDYPKSSEVEWQEFCFWKEVLHRKPSELRTFFLMKAVGMPAADLLAYAQTHFGEIKPFG